MTSVDAVDRPVELNPSYQLAVRSLVCQTDEDALVEEAVSGILVPRRSLADVSHEDHIGCRAHGDERESRVRIARRRYSKPARSPTAKKPIATAM